MAQNRFHTRQAAAALLKMARATTDPNVAARLVEAAADLQEQQASCRRQAQGSRHPNRRVMTCELP